MTTISSGTDNLDGFVPYPPAFVARYRQAGYWQDRTLSHVFDDLCTRYAERTAMVANAERITYGQLAARARRLALHFFELGLRPGDYVVMQLPNVPEFLYVYLALQQIGVRPVMALATHRFTEINHFVGLSRAVAYIMPQQQGDFHFAELACTLQQAHEHMRLVLVLGEATHPGHVSLLELLASDCGLPARVLDDLVIDPMAPALLLLSGGTTGISKLIPRTHNDYVYNSQAAAALSDIRPDDRLLVALPMAHNFALACPGVQGFLFQGAGVVLSPSTRSQDIFELVERERVTHLELVPTLLVRLLNDPLRERYDLSSLRLVSVGGQKIRADIKRRTEELLPPSRFQEIFGMAEGLLCYARLDDPDEERYETVGRPASPDDEVRLVDDEGNDVPDGQIGEMIVRGPYTLRGYFRAAEYNARSFTPDGFYKSGDLMRRTAAGNYIVEGRKKDLINRGGEKISAEEIEMLLLDHPAIFSVSCVAIPDPVLGEHMCACVVPWQGQTLTLQDAGRFLTDKGVAKFKLPEQLEIFEDFPLTRIGKVSKPQLIERVQERTQPDEARSPLTRSQP